MAVNKEEINLSKRYFCPLLTAVFEGLGTVRGEYRIPEGLRFSGLLPSGRFSYHFGCGR